MTIDELRKHLFATLDALRDEKSPMDIERAKAISNVAQTIINSAKAETDHMRVSGRPSASGFIPEQPLQRQIGAVRKAQ